VTVTRLGTWHPTSGTERIERAEAILEVQQLPQRYALALDGRDLDALVELFVPDVRVGGGAVGREALRRWFDVALRKVRASVHVVANHVIDFDAADAARGVVYCRDEVEVPERGEWRVGMLQYWDTYRRIGPDWYFERRRFHRWYQVDALERPRPGAGVNEGANPITTVPLPQAFATWQAFWDRPESS
jgi:hypothetical protein